MFNALLVIVASAMTAATATSPSMVHITIDPAAERKPISRYIYGVNRPLEGDYANLPLTRLGGNRWTAYNWINNASNAGNDWQFENDNFLGGGDVPGGAMIPEIENARKNHAGIILTIPMAGYVSADKKADGDVRHSGPDYLKTRFVPSVPKRADPADVVAQDEMVRWLNDKYPSGWSDPQTPIFLMLDNEPDIWAQTHAEVHPLKTTYAELIQRTLDYASAIKDVQRKAIIYGPANYGWHGYVTLQDATDAGGRDFQEVYLKAMSDAEKATGRRLLDVLDVHWYPEVRVGGVRITEPDSSPAVAAARIQAPRSLWDPDYLEESWITKNNLHAPIALIPRLWKKIENNYPGTKLSISEYNFGGPGDISGAIAEADALGIFGREGLFSANVWPLQNEEPFIAHAMAMFKPFGDISIAAKTDNIADTSVYASIASQSGDLIIVAINKTDHEIAANLEIKGDPKYKCVESWLLTGRLFKNSGGDPNRWPAYSVQTFRFTHDTTPTRH